MKKLSLYTAGVAAYAATFGYRYGDWWSMTRQQATTFAAAVFAEPLIDLSGLSARLMVGSRRAPLLDQLKFATLESIAAMFAFSSAGYPAKKITARSRVGCGIFPSVQSSGRGPLTTLYMKDRRLSGLKSERTPHRWRKATRRSPWAWK